MKSNVLKYASNRKCSPGLDSNKSVRVGKKCQSKFKHISRSIQHVDCSVAFIKQQREIDVESDVASMRKVEIVQGKHWSFDIIRFSRLV